MTTDPAPGRTPSLTINGHGLDDLSPDDLGRWWWLCTCESAEGGHFTEHQAHRAWVEHAEAAHV